MPSNLLEDLPIELLLTIISNLPLQSLHRFCRVSKFANHIISSNEALVYRQTALLHRYVDRADTIDPPRTDSRNPTYPLVNTTSWKQYCQLCLDLDRNWAGQGEVIPRTYCTKNADVHRVKVDEDRGLLFTSHETGGIIVTDLESGEILWTLPQNYVRTHAHLEYDNGFLIFDRFDSDKEVWRLATDFELWQIPASAYPDSPQRIASLFAEARYSTNNRGHLSPWALLTTTQPTFAYRFAYPTLIVMSMDTAYLWDIPTSTLVQTIRDAEEPFTHNDGDGDERSTISYVDVSARHIFICGWHELRIFNRSDGTLALRIPSQPTFANTRVLLSHERRDALTAIVPLRAEILPPARPSTLPLPSFVAAHASRCGRHLVAMLADNRLLLIEDFERVVRSQVSLVDAALEVNITLPENAMFIGVYLAYEFGRVSVVTTSGVYVFTLDAAEHLLIDPSIPPSRNSLSLGLIRPSPSSPTSPPASSVPRTTSFRNLAAAYLPRLRNKHVLINLSCLQMSATRLYLTWDRRRADIFERLTDAALGGLSAGADDGWRFDVEADNMDMYDDMLEDEMTLPPGPVMELHAEFGAIVMCLDFRPPAVRTLDPPTATGTE